jgi:uncharacterized protein YlxP (DUF503 family)
MPFICLLQLDLHLPSGSDLKGKRRALTSLKAQLGRRFGAAVAETAHHDLWQRSTLTIALVSGERRPLEASADALQRFVDSRLGDETRWERTVLSTEELTEGG